MTATGLTARDRRLPQTAVTATDSEARRVLPNADPEPVSSSLCGLDAVRPEVALDALEMLQHSSHPRVPTHDYVRCSDSFTSADEHESFHSVVHTHDARSAVDRLLALEFSDCYIATAAVNLTTSSALWLELTRSGSRPQ